MYTLILDCAYKPVVSILRDGKELKTVVSENTNHSDNYMLLIDEILKTNNLNIKEIDEFMINVGPGSFTGLRVSVSILKGFTFDERKNILSFNSFDYLNNKNEILLPAFSNFVYRKDKNGTMFCDNISALNKSSKYQTINKDLAEKLNGFNVNVCKSLSYEEIYKNVNKTHVDSSHIEPLYLRKSQAEIEREKRKN